MEVGRVSLVGVRVVKNPSKAELALKGCAVTGACQLPTFIAPWSRSAVTEQPESTSTNDGTLSDYLQLQAIYQSPLVESLRNSLTDNNRQISAAKISELSLMVRNSRVDVRWEELLLLNDVCTDFIASLEQLKAVFLQPQQQQQAELHTRTRALAAAISSEGSIVTGGGLEKVASLEDVQQCIEEAIKCTRSMQSASEVDIEPFLLAAEQEGSDELRRLIRSCVRNPESFTSNANCGVTGRMRDEFVAVPPVVCPPATSDSVLLLRIRVCLPSVYWLSPEMGSPPPSFEEIHREPEAPLMFQLGKIVVLV